MACWGTIRLYDSLGGFLEQRIYCTKVGRDKIIDKYNTRAAGGFYEISPRIYLPHDSENKREKRMKDKEVVPFVRPPAVYNNIKNYEYK